MVGGVEQRQESDAAVENRHLLNLLRLQMIPELWLVCANFADGARYCDLGFAGGGGQANRYVCRYAARQCETSNRICSEPQLCRSDLVTAGDGQPGKRKSPLG